MITLLEVNVLVALAWLNHVHHDAAHVRKRRFALSVLE